MRRHAQTRGTTWSYVIYLGRDPDGKKNYKWVGGHATKHEAEDQLVAALERLRTGMWTDPGTMTMCRRTHCRDQLAERLRLGEVWTDSGRMSVDLDASTSVDPSGSGLSYAWDLDGDGEYDDATGPTASRTFTTPTNATIGLRVRTSEGEQDTTAVTIYPGNTAPHLSINVTSPLPFVAHQQIDFDLVATDDEQGTLPVSAVSWSTQLQHCYSLSDCHNHPMDSLDGSISGSVEGPSHEYPSFVQVTASAIDDRGETTVVTQQLQPQVVTLLINSNPWAATIAIGSETFTAPQTVEMIKGSEVTVSAISPQVLGGFSHVFFKWNDGGAKTHTVIADTDKTITVQMVPG